MSDRVLPLVIYTEQGRVVLGDVDVDKASANLNEEGAALLDTRLQPAVDDEGNEIQGDLPIGFQFVLGPYFPPTRKNEVEA